MTLRGLINSLLFIAVFSMLIPAVAHAAATTSDVPISDGFDFPVGKPDGDNYSIAGWDFLENEGPKHDYTIHPGEDWNGNGGGDSDLGDPVYAVSNGHVIYASNYTRDINSKAGWGNIVLIEHKLQNGTTVWSQYAHLNSILVENNTSVERGQKIGTIGKGAANYPAHLHFEIRKNKLSPGAWPGSNKTYVLENYLDPSDFINATRPQLDKTENNANVILVIDRSGSMAGDPISSAKNSASLFVDYMETEDMVGVVSFSSSARYDYRLTNLTPEVKIGIKQKINSISASGGTAIGSGLQYGLTDLLNYGNPKNPWAIVLLSDGYSGDNPNNVITSLKAKNVQVYTIGLGPSVDEDLLKSIAFNTGGRYYRSPENDQLQRIYGEIVGKIISWDTIRKRSVRMFPNDIWRLPVMVDSSISRASFGISWPGSNVDLILYKPDGSIVTPSVAGSDPTIEYLNASTYKIYKVTDPEPGEWTMELTATDMPVGGEDVYATVLAESTLSMLLSTDKDQYKQGEDVKIIANFSNSVTKITAADIEVNVTLPDSSVEHLMLYDDGGHGDGGTKDGVYANFFVNTLLKGDYRIDATSTGSLSDGSQFSRIQDTSFEVIPGAPIIVEAGPDQTVDEGAIVNLGGNFTASGSHTYSYHWDFGDGSTEDSSLTTSHTYADDGSYTVDLTVTDEQGDFGNDTLLVTVDNVVPVVNAGSDIVATAGDPISFTGNFSDPGWLDTHTAEWNFGESTVEAGSVSEENESPDSTGTVSGSFSYFDAGEYPVTLKVSDDDGGIGQDQLTVTVRPIEAEVTLDPKTLNLNSNGEWVTAYVELPVSYNASGIDIGTVFLNGTLPAVSDPKYDFVTNESEYLTDLDLDGIPERMFKFNRGEVAGILKAGDQVIVTFTGKVEYNNGISSGMASFEGSDVIKVTKKDDKKS